MSQWQYFSDKELECQCNYPECDGGEMRPSFMARLVKLREHVGFPLPLSSGFRCARHNKDERGAEGSLHLTGEAVDIKISRDQAYKIVEAARKFGFKGVGVSQKGNNRFVHLDTRDKADMSFWSY